MVFNSKASGTINLWTAPTDAGTPKQLTFDRELMGFACWSPDGKYLVYERAEAIGNIWVLELR